MGIFYAVFAVFLSSSVHALVTGTPRRALPIEVNLEIPGCATEEVYSCLEEASNECGEGVFCEASEVCDYEDKDECKDEDDPGCAAKKSLQCVAAATECNSELSCDWREECVECELGEDCVGGHTCKALEDVPKICKPAVHFDCRVRNENASAPGYYGGWKLQWMKDNEWKKGDKCGEVDCGDQEHCANASVEDCEVDPDFFQVAYGGQVCGSQTCDPGFVCTGEVTECKEVITMCESKRNHFCVDQAITKHPGYIFKKDSSTQEECGLLFCDAAKCIKSIKTNCVVASSKDVGDEKLLPTIVP